MNLEERIQAFTTLGHFLSQFSRNGIKKKENIPNNDVFFNGFKHQIKLAKEHNGWFTDDNLLFAFDSWSKTLTYSNITAFVKNYHFKNITPKKVAIIMAGNIPLVGFHDFFCVLLSGHKVIVKQSSNDKHLLPYLSKFIEQIAPDFKNNITFTEEKLEGFDAVIATGSNNTARYFEYYFKNKPAIIRKNRNSVAILTGEETEDQLQALSEDIFRYYGLGCRNVSKIFVPNNYNFDAFFNAMYAWHPIINDSKYANNYDYNKAVYLMSEFDMLENGFLMLKEDTSYSSPIATVFYEHYNSLENLKTKLKKDADHIQCLVSNGLFDNDVAFGETQNPNLENYADDVDTMNFLLKIS